MLTILSLIIVVGIIGGLYWLVHSILDITYFGFRGMIMEFIVYLWIAFWLGDILLRLFVGIFKGALIVGAIGAVIVGGIYIFNRIKGN